jgi:hypothetical protein
MSDITPANYFPLGSTIQKSFTDLSSAAYEHFGIISVNPTNGHAIIVYRRGTTHVSSGDYGSAYIRHSTDGGANWGPESQIFSESGVDLRNIGGGYDSNGRLFVFYGRYNPDTSTWLSMNYRYSDNDGSTWSSQQTLTNQSNTAFSPHGHIIDAGNNTLYQTWYGVNGSTYSLYLYKSTDGGSSFSTVKQIYSGTNLYTEPSMANLGGGCFLVLSRINSGSTFRQFKSEDNCDNWSDQGATSFETWSSAANMQAPPFLVYMNYEGVGLAACYYTRRDTTPMKLKVVFGLAKNLLDGANGWNASTIKEIYSYTTINKPGYQSFFHPIKQYKGIGICFESASNYAYPKVVFTNTSSMINVLTTIGL